MEPKADMPRICDSPAFTFLSIHYHCFSVNNKHPRESQTEAGASSEDSAQGWALIQIPGVRMSGPREAGREQRAAPPSIPSRSWCGPAGPPVAQAFSPREGPHSLCGKSSALKIFRQKCAPRRATPVGRSRLPSMSSLSSEGSFLSSCNANPV